MKTGNKPLRMPGRILLVFSLLMLGIMSSGYLYYEQQKEHYFSGEKDMLTAIAGLKAEQLTNWRRERLADAQVIMDNRIVLSRIKEFFENPNRNDIRKELLEWMVSVKTAYEYTNIILFNINTDTILYAGDITTQSESHLKQSASEAIGSKKIIFVDFHKPEGTDDIHLELIIPLFISAGQPIGALVVVIDPYRFLYPHIQEWPVPSRTAETLLVRREGSDVLFLNELRHKKNTALLLRLPLSKKDLPATRGVLGEKGIVEGIDYRGVPVIAYTAPIPDSPWFIVAKRDKEEVFENFQHDAQIVTFIMLILIAVSAMGVILWWKKQELAYYRSQLMVAENLKRSNEELKQFAYIASHDLQEPLRMIASYLQLIERRYKGKLDKDADEFISFAVDGATRLQDMISGLLHYSRLETRSKPLVKVNSSEILGVAVSNLKVLIEESGALVTSDRLPIIMADAGQLVQVFQNLIANAIKFKGEAVPHIHISAEQKGNEWVFAVKDNGIGIAAEYSDRIFNIFQKLHGREYPGVGIGLSLCRRIVEKHGGRIWFESEIGKGTTFYFTIPIKEEKKNE